MRVLRTFWLVLISINSAGGSEIDPELQGRFLSGMSHSSHLVESLCVRIRSETIHEYCDKTVQANNSPKRLKIAKDKGLDLSHSVFVGEFAVCGKSVLQLGEREDGVRYVLAQNSDYGFHITESKGSDVYTIRSLEQSGRVDPRLEQQIEHQLRMATSPMFAAWSFLGTPMSEVVKGEGFRVDQIEEITSDGKTLVRVEFDPGDAFLFDQAYAICDPNNEWAFVEYGWTSAVLQKRVVIDYGEKVNGVPIVTTMQSTGTWIDEPENVDTEVMTQEILDTNVSEEIFRLSTYGLKEPYFERSWYSGTWLTYLAGGATCLGVAYWLRRRRLAVA